MDNLFPIKVQCHSGYKADEYPLRFHWNNILFEIEEILDRWFQGDQNPAYPAADYFKVRTTDGKIYILKHETERDEWLLWIRGERMDL